MAVIEQWPLHTLQQRILAALQRLNDLDTRSASYQTLLALILRVELDAIPIVVECLCQNHGRQKPAAKALVIELIGRLSASMKSSLASFTGRLVQFLLKALQEVEIQVQEASAVSLAQLCRYSLQESQLQSVLSSLYRLMANKPVPVQASVARALARLIVDLDAALLDTYYDAISNVIMKHLCKPSIHPILQRHLFHALAAIPPSKASPASIPNLFRMTTASLLSESWQVSQAAASALKSWADLRFYSVYGANVLSALQQVRFHRIAQVRETVMAAFNSWKALGNVSIVSSPRMLSETDETHKCTVVKHDQSELQLEHKATAPIPVPFEFAPEGLSSSKPKQRVFQQKILRQQRLLFDLVEDLCRRVDDGMINIKARLTSLEAATELLQQQHQQQQQQRSYDMDPLQPRSSTNSTWAKVVESLEQNHVFDAVKLCCESGDDSSLIRLLGRLSIETEIEIDLWPMLMTRFSVLLARNLFVDNVATWILKALRDGISIPLTVQNAIRQAKSQSNPSPSILTLSTKLDSYLA